MAKQLRYLGKTLEFPLEDDRFVGVWTGPQDRSPIDLARALRESLETPIDLPALGRCVVPGDRVTIAVDLQTPELATCIAVIVNVLESAGVDREGILVLAPPDPEIAFDPTTLPAGIEFRVHHPENQDDLAYLATTNEGRRVYLNRALTDADFVLPMGMISKDPAIGWSGPWSTLFPGLSDVSTRAEYAAGGAGILSSAIVEPAEVSWLLGNQFQIGLLAGTEGVVAIFAGLAERVRTNGIGAAQEVWTFRVDRRADLVVVGVSAKAGLDSTWDALSTGARLARRGGKVVALSDASGSIGSAARQLIGTESYASATSALKAADGAPDFASAARLAEALAWADLYLYSELNESDVEDLGIVPLGKPTEAQRLAAVATDIILVSSAESTQVVVSEENP